MNEMVVDTAFLSETHDLDDFRSTPALPATADIVVIGAGIGGCSAALHCSRLVRSCVS